MPQPGKKPLSPEKLKELKEKELADETKRVLKDLKRRKCKENIKQYKEELSKLRYLQNPFNVTMSYSNIESRINRIAPKHSDPEDASQNQFKRLREYLRLYKQRLYLVPRH